MTKVNCIGPNNDTLQIEHHTNVPSLRVEINDHGMVATVALSPESVRALVKDFQTLIDKAEPTHERLRIIWESPTTSSPINRQKDVDVIPSLTLLRTSARHGAGSTHPTQRTTQ